MLLPSKNSIANVASTLMQKDFSERASFAGVFVDIFYTACGNSLGLLMYFFNCADNEVLESGEKQLVWTKELLWFCLPLLHDL